MKPALFNRAAGGGAEPSQGPWAAVYGILDSLARRLRNIEDRPAPRDGRDGAPGRDGKDGASVTGLRLDADGHLRVSVGGVESDLGNVVGARGEAGPPGESIAGERGEPGEKGEAVIGPPGNDGIGIAAASITDAGHLSLTLTDDRKIDVGMVRGPAGRDGDAGAAGTAFLTGMGAPARLGRDGDLYLDMETGYLYRFRS